MKEVNEEAWAAVRRVLDWTRPTLTASEANDLTTVLSLLPDALTNPQPNLPTEPMRLYVDRVGDVWRTDENGLLQCVGGEHFAPKEFAPFTRLVPERAQVTGTSLKAAWKDGGFHWDRLADYVNEMGA